MNSNQEDKVERLVRFRRSTGLSSKDFALKAGIDPSNYSSIETGKRSFGNRVMRDICSTFPIDMEWLLSGEGEMLKDTSSELPVEARYSRGYTMVPVYNFDAVGGMDGWNEVIDSPEYIERYIPLDTAKTGDLCIHVTGNSMAPTYSAGSLLLVRRVEGWREYFGYGHAYVLLLRDGRRILKEVQKSEVSASTHVLCASYNPKNQPEELPRDFIVDVYKVIYTLTNEGF